MGKEKGRDTRSRKYLLTINNPQKHNITHETIKKALQTYRVKYLSLCDEIGSQKTLHIHVYVYYINALRFSSIKKLLPNANIQTAYGSSQDNRAYLLKSKPEHNKDENGFYSYVDSFGKEHSGQNLTETFEEIGDCPEEKQGKRSDLQKLFEMITDGMGDAEILRENPDYMKYLNYIERTRQTLREEEFRDKWRDISCIYVYGATDTNKTRTYMEKYQYPNVYRITNYAGNAIWDGYRGQDVVIFEEYRSQLPISELLVWTEGYPNVSLRARYADKVACYTKVVFISNIALEKQYPNVQEESPETWNAFLRRIQKVIHHKSKQEIIAYNSVGEYLHRHEQFHPITDGETPFDKPDGEQMSLPDIPECGNDEPTPFD